MKIFISIVFVAYSSFALAGISSSPSPQPSPNAPVIPSDPKPQEFNNEAVCRAEAAKKTFSEKESGELTNPCDKTGKTFHPTSIESQGWSCAISPSFGGGAFKINWVLYRASVSLDSYSFAKYVAPAGVRYAGNCFSALYSTGSVSQSKSTCLADNSTLQFFDSQKVKMSKAPSVTLFGRKLEGGGTDGFVETKIVDGEQETTSEERAPHGNRCIVTQKKSVKKAVFKPVTENGPVWKYRN